MGFETTRKNALPVWLDGEQGRGYEGTLGASQDDEWTDYKAAIKLRWPLRDCIDETDEQALYHAGQTRQIERAPPETGAAYRDRLYGAHERWYWAGTESGIKNIFEPYLTYNLFFSDPIRFYPCSLEYTHLDDGSLFYKHHAPTSEHVFALDYADHDTEGPIGPGTDADHYSRSIVWVNSVAGDPWGPDLVWDDPGEWDDGGLWDTTMTVADVKYILRMIRRWKGPANYPVFIAVELDADHPFWCTPGEWDDGGLWEDEATSDPLYITVGHVWHEEAGLGGWLGWVSPQLTDIWDDFGRWEGYVDPADFGT